MRRQVEELAVQDPELNRLLEEHEAFEQQLHELDSRPFLTPAQQTERKRLQKLKLAGKDRIEEILARYRATKKEGTTPQST
ncbi:MAG: DUF465 domain-containing protein [Deltaproteobacteria bacterium]|nr:DUF465 domain-containing protein [Deltaproteobacteria bacterium]MBI3078531.1 DUF465 domain-containing protein [Deltaproteobacteria bacterium]